MILLVLYGYETGSLTLRAKYRLRVFEKKLMKKIFGPKRTEVTGECRRLHYISYFMMFPPQQILLRFPNKRVMRWVGMWHVLRERRGAYTILLRKPERRRPLGRTARRWENNIKIYLPEVEWGNGVG